MSYLFSGFEEKERIPHLEKEITRLQELCRTNFGIISELKKENQKLKEIHLELKETTSDLAYSLAEYPWWGDVDHTHTINAFKVLVTYTKNIQYILQLPIFFDPLEQLKAYGFNQERALRYLKLRYFPKNKGIKLLKCPKCKKEFTTEERRKKHILFHNNMNKKLHCKECGKHIPTFQSFKSHMQSHKFTNQMMTFTPPITFHKHVLDPFPEAGIRNLSMTSSLAVTHTSVLGAQLGFPNQINDDSIDECQLKSVNTKSNSLNVEINQSPKCSDDEPIESLRDEKALTTFNRVDGDDFLRQLNI